MLTNWATPRRECDLKKRLFGGKLVQFKYGKVKNWFYYGHHAVYEEKKTEDTHVSILNFFSPQWVLNEAISLSYCAVPDEFIPVTQITQNKIQGLWRWTPYKGQIYQNFGKANGGKWNTEKIKW